MFIVLGGNMDSTKIIVQARTGSTRLPNKMVLPFFDNKGVLEITLEKLIKSYGKESVILATTNSVKDDELEKIGINKGVHVYRGSEDDVLSRFIESAEKYNVKNIIRVCADNPFLISEDIKPLIEELENKDIDYVSYRVNKRPSILSHFGLWTEGVKLDALKKVNNSTSEKIFLEHVTNYIHSGNPIIFNVKLIDVDKSFEENSNVRLTLDTPEDFDIQKKIYSDLYSDEKEINFKDIIKYLKKNESLKKTMIKQIKENEK